MKRVGVISDTHGLLRESAAAALHGCDMILHAGDIGHQGIVDTLASIAPVVAVRGNMDRGEWADRLPVFETVTVAGADIYMLHDLLALDLDPAGYFAVVIHGHTHAPSGTTRDGVLYFNPGSAGPRRSSLPVSVGLLTIDDASVKGTWVMLDA
ncbi:metallophosphoesterase family protein [Desulfosudis oleivorans]|uniref:Phosphoesterase n=1 Tax=Desulfosudis oleivorans (strain DSM 6200 / JCM 39069 / Hxd3) TaxID=96561 RepID=A8ZSX0_DESOH|nr:metallophosphoesterase family protein [Desulfosudis oleivorans]ABW66134.1 phosphodiesterase, MJ0936 family [Desulfosudis oleivorans Hxd3]